MTIVVRSYTVCSSLIRNFGMNKNHYNVCTTKCTPVKPYDGDDDDDDGVNDDDKETRKNSAHINNSDGLS